VTDSMPPDILWSAFIGRPTAVPEAASERQEHSEGASPTLPSGLGPDAAAVQFDEALGQREAEACSLALGAGFAELDELVKEAGQVLNSDADPRIFHAEFQKRPSDGMGGAPLSMLG